MGVRMYHCLMTVTKDRSLISSSASFFQDFRPLLGSSMRPRKRCRFTSSYLEYQVVPQFGVVHLTLLVRSASLGGDHQHRHRGVLHLS